jgi:hypothetical protein
MSDDNLVQNVDIHDIKATRHVRKSDFTTLFNMLETRGHNIAAVDTFTVGVGGGILFRTTKGHRSIRFSTCFRPGNAREREWVKNNRAEWKDDNTIVIHKYWKKTLRLKVRGGAPRFTQKELRDVEECFEHIDIIRMGKFPSEKKLRQVWLNKGSYRMLPV